MVLFCACTGEELDGGEATGRGAVCISLLSGGMERTRAGESVELGDPEYYMGTIYLFFYTDTTKASVMARTVTADCYNAKSIQWRLSDDEVDTLFPDTTTQCRMYVVTNVPTGSIAENTQYSLADLKGIALSSDFSVAPAEGDFAMDGEGVLVLNRQTMGMSAKVSLRRSLVKIALEPHVVNSIEVTEGGKKVTYEPVLTTVTGGSSLTSTFDNSVTNGVLNGSLAAAERTYTNLSATYSQSTDVVEDGSSVFTQQPFYSYPQDWESKYDDNQPSIRLEVVWKKVGEDTYKSYYYLLSISDKANRLERNHFYNIKLTVGMLGSTDPNEPFELDSYDYEIMDWGTSNALGISATVNDFHFLVAEDHSFTLWNADDVSFAFNSCYELKGVYLTSVSFESTKYPNDDGSARLVYLYNTDYNETTHEYTETTTYGEKDITVQKENDVVANNVKEIVTVTYTTDRDAEGVPTGNGTITFHAPIDQTAARLYRPITYTLVLVNSEAHNYLRQTVKITQYPAKYIEYGPSDNCFVNGYYARVEGEGTYELTTGSDLYQAYFFLQALTTYTAVKNNSDYTGYFSFYRGLPSERLDGFTTPSYGSNSTFSYQDLVTKYGAISTGYEYLYGYDSEDLTQKETTDVHVSAFTSTDNTFSIASSSGETQTYDYRLGDPRTASGYTADDHTKDGTYTYTGTMLYDYYVKGATHRNIFITYYDRYIQSWGDNAGKIKIGGESSEYDYVIAPIYKIASSYGALISTSYFKVAQKRCATYQEAGYPAGRWRLPTLAEIAFIARLQKNEVIDKLFLNDDIGYWTSSGGKIVVGEDVITYTSGYASQSSSNVCYARCVYDLWYWRDGDNDAQQHLPINKYHPYPTLQKK